MHCLPTSSIQAYFYQELKHKGPDFGEQILKKLKQCADELHVTDTGDDYEPIATSQESVDEFDDVWANIKSVYDALVACACETGHIEDFYETTLQLAVKLKQESHNYYGVDILIPRANSSYPNELHFSVTENLRLVNASDRRSGRKLMFMLEQPLKLLQALKSTGNLKRTFHGN